MTRRCKNYINIFSNISRFIFINNYVYSIIVYIRHNGRYPYQNMWLFTGDSFYRDTIEFYLADDLGQWLGDRHHGFVEMPVLLEDNKHFADTGAYYLEIQHGMRDTLLRGVTDVGVEIIRISRMPASISVDSG